MQLSLAAATEQQQLQLKLKSIFAPKVASKQYELLTSGRKVAHYTTADNALRILRGEQVWMRNVKYMNDFQEFKHGFEMMVRFFAPVTDGAPDVGQRDLFSALNSVYPGIVEKTIGTFNSWVPQIQNNTYVACLSDHSREEDEIGRLSMWRGYSYNLPAVAIVINPDIFATTTDALGAYSSPVVYQTQGEFFAGLRATSALVLDNADVIKGIGQDTTEGWLFQTLLHYAVCQKHRGFAEEREWRILHIPRLHPAGKMTKATETIRNRPQVVYKLPLQSYPDEGVVGASVTELLHCIVIGPTEEPGQIKEAFVALLEELGIPDGETKVVVSDIPFRGGL